MSPNRIGENVNTTIRAMADLRAAWWWRLSGRRGPLPSRAKHALLRVYAREYGLRTLVETGTYLGDTVAALQREFSRIYSIELGPDLAKRAQHRFRGLRHVTVLHGDSATVLPHVLASLTEPALFWLDGHYSGGVTAYGPTTTPLAAELDAVLAHPVRNHVLLIDDAGWLKTQLTHEGLDDVLERIRSARPDWRVYERDDVIRAHGPGSF